MSRAVMGRVVVVGSVNRDYVCRVEQIPVRGETVLGADVELGSGGKGGNQAVAAAKAGATTLLVGRIGDDHDGRAVRTDLEAAGVETSGLEALVDVSTGAAFVLVAADGENAIVVSPGANARLAADDVDAFLRRVLDVGDVVLTQGEIPVAVIAATVGAATEAGARAVLNLAPYVDVDDEVLAACDPLVVNESEATHLLGRPVRGLADAHLAVAELAWRCRSAVLTLGAEGALLADSSGVQHIPAEPVAAVDTTGAGDAFAGFMAAALSAGQDLATAVSHGVRAGTVTVTRLGAQVSFPDDFSR